MRSAIRGPLRIALDNRFANAWKYPFHEPTAWIRFHEQVHEGVVWYVVADNGIGFDMVYGDRLFGPFQRLHKDKDFAGAGVGLATVARIVHRHGGCVHARGRGVRARRLPSRCGRFRAAESMVSWGGSMTNPGNA